MAKKVESGNDELLEEIARLKAELAERGGESGEAPVSAYNGDELVEYMAPIIGASEQDMEPLFVCVNGESVAIKPGVPVMLKRKFVDAIARANDQRIAAWNFMRDAQEAGRKALSEM